MCFLLAIFLMVIGSCAAADNSSSVDVDIFSQQTGRIDRSAENVNTTSLNYTLSVNFSHFAERAVLSISVSTTLNDTRVTVGHPVDGDDVYITSKRLQVYRVGPTATVRVLLTRPYVNAGFELAVEWSLTSIRPNTLHTVELTADRPSYIEYQGFLGVFPDNTQAAAIGHEKSETLTVNGALVLSTPPGSDVCISRPQSDDVTTSTMFVFAGDFVNNYNAYVPYVGRVDKLFGCAADRDMMLPSTFTVVAPDTVSIVDTPVFTLKSALTSYSLSSFSPQLLNDGSLTVTIDQTPQTFLDSQHFSTLLQTTLTDFQFSDDDALLQVWCGSLYNRKSADKYMIANISRSSLDYWAHGGTLNVFCRSLTLKTSMGTVNVRIGSALKGGIFSSRLVKIGSRGTLTNFNYPFPDLPDLSFWNYEIQELHTDNHEDAPFHLLFSELETHTSAMSWKTNGLGVSDNNQSVSPGQLKMSGYAMQVRSSGDGVHYRMEYSVGGGSHLATTAAFILSAAALLWR